MSEPPEAGDGPIVSRAAATAWASSAFVVPLVLSASSSPSPNHPREFFWYWSLRKPAIKPPDWLIPVAWFGIEGSLAAAGYRLLRSPPSRARRRALSLLAWNIFMIGGWSRLFFERRELALSTVAAATMVITGVEFVREAKQVDAVASRSGIPFVAWVSFATVLTASIWRLTAAARIRDGRAITTVVPNVFFTRA